MKDEARKEIRTLEEGAEAPFVASSRPSAPELAGLVERITLYSENGAGLVGAVEMAPLVVPLIVGFGEPFAIALDREPGSGDRHGSFTSGLHPGWVRIDSSGRSRCIQIDFTPLGALRFFGFPMSEVAGRMVSLEDIGDRDIGVLRRRLEDAASWRDRLAIAEEFLRERLLRSTAGSEGVARAHAAIVERRGVLRIGELARALDWSRKHLNERFRAEVGVGPKVFSRMVRFNRALAMARSETAGWADIAFECGYADQAHLVREFREFSGSTPAALTRLRT